MADKESEKSSEASTENNKFSHKSRDKSQPANKERDEYKSITPEQLKRMPNPDELING